MKNRTIGFMLLVIFVSSIAIIFRINIAMGIVASSLYIIFILLLLLMRIKNTQRQLECCQTQLENVNEISDTFINAYDSFVYLKDENLKYVFTNYALARYLNKTVESIVRCDDFDINFDLANAVRKTELSVLEKKKTTTNEFEIENKVYKITAFPVKLLGGMIGVGAFINEVTKEGLKQGNK